MTVVGFNFVKMNVERTGVPRGKVSINNNVNIKSIEKVDLALGESKQQGLKFNFVFNSNFDPGIGKIELEGEVLYMGTDEKVKEILSTWDTEKKVSKDIVVGVLNSILAKCNVQAISLAHELNLPSPVPLPTVNVNQEKKNGKSDKS